MNNKHFRLWPQSGRLKLLVLVSSSLAGLFAGTLLAEPGGRQRAPTRATPNGGGAVRVAAEDEDRRPLVGAPRLPAEQPPIEEPQPLENAGFPGGFRPEQLVSPGGLSSTLNLMILLTVLSLAPSILIMTTCFVRFVIVLGLLRQALGTQQLPPNQVLLPLCLFLTFLVMAPVWQQSYEQGIKPYTNPEPGIDAPSLQTTFERSVYPIRRFMSEQIEQAGNSDTVWMLLEAQRPAESPNTEQPLPESYDEVPLSVLVPAYMLSELKAAFLIGFQIFLPFVVIDMVVATVLMSMGMMMLPPTLVSFPFKLLLFVLIDGWALTVGMMLASVVPTG